MLTERHVTVAQPGLDRGKFGCAQIFLSQKTIDRSRADPGQECSFRVHPAITPGRSGTQKHGARGAERDQCLGWTVRLDSARFKSFIAQSIPFKSNRRKAGCLKSSGPPSDV